MLFPRALATKTPGRLQKAAPAEKKGQNSKAQEQTFVAALDFSAWRSKEESNMMYDLMYDENGALRRYRRNAGPGWLSLGVKLNNRGGRPRAGTNKTAAGGGHARYQQKKPRGLAQGPEPTKQPLVLSD